MENSIEIKKGEQYLKTAKQLSKIISELPISKAENNVLIAAILEHTEAGRIEAYAQGVGDALDINSDLLLELVEMEIAKNEN